MKQTIMTQIKELTLELLWGLGMFTWSTQWIYVSKELEFGSFHKRLTSIKNDIVQKLVIFIISRFIDNIFRKTRLNNVS